MGRVSAGIPGKETMRRTPPILLSGQECPGHRETPAVVLAALLGLFPGLSPVPPAAAQDLKAATGALVRISGTREDTPVRGSGFVVAVNGDKATIVTASHVIEGVQDLRVTFAADPTESHAAGEVFGMEPQDPNGLAAFQVRGRLPKELTWLLLDADRRPAQGDDLFLLGFPERALTPVSPKSVLSGRAGALLVIDLEVGEGFSGGPVLQGPRVVGVVTTTGEGKARAVSAVVAREILLGWGVKLGGPPCVRGEEREHEESGIVFVRICGGTFTMGSADGDPDEKPAHPVTLSDFWIGKTEVSNGQYRSFRPDHQGEARLPAVNVSWESAKAACEQWGGRLPTEAEWEYAARAARAGNPAPWSFGADAKKLGEYAWYGKNSGGKVHPVGGKKANAWGLHDMYGNAWEWVADGYGPYPEETPRDPKGPATGDHLLRGGSFDNDDPMNLRSANRHPFTTGGELIQGIGFRCVRDSAPLPRPAVR
jgi:formylglycine-generating enzyme required for sulfatase activity